MPDGKARIERFEQQKTGTTDTHPQAQEQNRTAVRAISEHLSGGRRVRVETREHVDITEQLDLTSATNASQVTVGPASGSKFDYSLGITAADLEALITNLVTSGAG
jgi:hypothetical protein